MTVSRRPFWPLLALSLAAFAADAKLTAQPKGAPPIVAPPQAPTLAPPFPLGVQRGTALELTLTGTNLAEPTGVWASFPAKVTIPTDANNGKDNAKLRVKLEVPADAPLGFHAIRVATRHGISNARVFCVDELPQVTEVDTNRTKATAQQVPVPCVVAGRTDAEVSDYFKFVVKAGQRVTFEILGRRLGNPLDPILTLYDAKTGREVPGLYDDDAPGLQSDARLTHTFKEAGEYLVEVRDTTHRGGPDYFYRLRIGDFPAATTPLPVALKRGSKAAVSFAGPHVEGVAPVEVTAPADPAKAVIEVAPKGPGGLHGWPVSLQLSDVDELLETEPNNDPAKANRVPVPGGVTGRFLEKGDRDYFVFAAKKGQKVTITAATYEISSPAEVYLVIKDAKNADLAKSNPQAAPRIEFTPPADGDYFLVAEHLNYAHGPNEVYHLSLRAGEPDFDVVLGLDRFEVAPGGAATIPVMSVVRRDYAGPIELTVEGHPFLGGTVTIPAGAAAAPPNSALAFLPLTAKPDAPVGPHAFRVRAKGTVNGKDVIRYATVTDIVKQNMAGLAFPPREMFSSLAVAVGDKPLFALTAKFDVPEAIRGGGAKFTITAVRAQGFAEEITLAPVGLPPNVAVKMKNIPKGMNEVSEVLNVAANAPLGTFRVTFRGTAKTKGGQFAYYAAPVELNIAPPFALKLEPSPVVLKPGAKAKVKVTAVRKGGYAGPINVEFKNLPAGVTGPKVTTIAAKQDSVEVELVAAANAAAGDKPDVNAVGTATAAANQQATSANITVRVAK